MITYKRYFNREFVNLPGSKEGGFRGLEAVSHAWFNSVRSVLPKLFSLSGIKKGDIVLLPAISPHGIALPCKRSKVKILFYHLDNNFNPDKEHIRLLLEENDVRALFLIHYFGIYRDFQEISDYSRERQCIVFEDCAHTLFSDFSKIPAGKTGDIAFFSLNKILPVPDGALFISNSKEVSFEAIKTEQSISNSIAVSANFMNLVFRTFSLNPARSRLIKSLFSLTSKIFYALYYRAICYTRKPAALSARTKLLLSKLNIEKIIEKRIDNAAAIAVVVAPEKAAARINKQLLTGIPVSGPDAMRIKKILAADGIKTMTCNKKWWFVPSSQKRTFRNEYRLINSHFLIPVTENISSEQMQVLSIKLREILTNANID